MYDCQASFSTASHGSLDSIDDDIDFKLDDDLRSQIEQMGLQKREENTLEQLEVWLGCWRACMHRASWHCICNVHTMLLDKLLGRLKVSCL